LPLMQDLRRATIWTGSNEVQRLIVQNEIFREILTADTTSRRNIELDTPGAHKTAEKVFTEELEKYYPKDD